MMQACGLVLSGGITRAFAGGGFFFHRADDDQANMSPAGLARAPAPQRYTAALWHPPSRARRAGVLGDEQADRRGRCRYGPAGRLRDRPSPMMPTALPASSTKASIIAVSMPSNPPADANGIAFVHAMGCRRVTRSSSSASAAVSVTVSGDSIHPVTPEWQQSTCSSSSSV